MAWTQQVRDFSKEVRLEFGKISWPTRAELQESTVVVIVTILLVTVFVGIVDQGLTVLGVTRFIGSGQSAVALKENEVRRVLGQMEATKSKPTPTVSFRVGDHVRVVDGPFSAFTGVVDEVNGERGKVKVMVSIFGRATPVELDFLQVQPV